jgi:hypothetical protein
MSDTAKGSAGQGENSVPQADGAELKDEQLESVAGGRRFRYPLPPTPVYPIDPTDPIILPIEPIVGPIELTDGTTQ